MILFNVTGICKFIYVLRTVFLYFVGGGQYPGTECTNVYRTAACRERLSISAFYNPTGLGLTPPMGWNTWCTDGM